MLLTTKQIEIIRVVGEGNDDGSHVDIDQLITRCNYKPTKDSIHFSLRALINHGLIEKTESEKRRGRRRTIVAPTLLGRHFAAANKSSASAILEPDDLGMLG